MASTAARPTRPVNVQPNHLPTSIVIKAMSALLKAAATITVPQADNLSDKGNISFTGGIRRGLRLVGNPAEVLSSFAFEANGVALTTAPAGVHMSSDVIVSGPRAGQAKTPHLTVYNGALVELPSTSGEPIAYRVGVQLTHLGERPSRSAAEKASGPTVDDGYSLTVTGFVAGTGFEAKPLVRGEVSGLEVASA